MKSQLLIGLPIIGGSGGGFCRPDWDNYVLCLRATDDSSDWESYMTSARSIKLFWNRAAEQNPYWYVSSYGLYDAKRNVEEFWASGKTIWANLKDATGYIPQPTHAVVEIGCGVGRLTRAIAPEVDVVTSLDISEKMLQIARESSLSNVDFRLAQGFTLEGIPDKSADLAIAYCIFQHLPNLAALKSYLDEMWRVTKPGGLLAFTLTPRDWSFYLLPVLRLRARLRDKSKGLHRKEWIGIRPKDRHVFMLCPAKLQKVSLGAERNLYFGTV